MKQIQIIQQLRAFAAIGIVVFHQNHSLKIGNASVDVFFIISGFIICIIIDSYKNNPLQFFLRRIARIAPLYWIVTLVSVLLVKIYPESFGDADIRPFHIIYSFFFIPHWDVNGKIWPTLLQGWTLNLEFFFYAIMTFALCFSRRLNLIYISVFFIALVICGVLFHFHSAVCRSYTANILMELVAGLWLGFLWKKRLLPSMGIGIFLCIVGVSILSVEQIWMLKKSIALARVPYYSLPALLIVLGALSIEASGHYLKSSLLKVIGEASYAIYLTHILVAIPVKGLLIGYKLPAGIEFGVSIAILVSAGVLIHYLVERPANEWTRKILKC